MSIALPSFATKGRVEIYPGALHLCYFFPILSYKDIGALHLIGYNAKGQRPAIYVENSIAHNPEVQRTGILFPGINERHS